MIRLIELFSGIGAFAKALENLKIPHERTAVAEIDKRAYDAYCAIHGDTPNLGDVTKIDALPECDILTYSFPCQDLSMAGNLKGMERGSGTRSSLLWEVERLLKQYTESGRTLPKYLIMENVDQIANKKNIGAFTEWISILTGMGYTSSWKILNAKDYGIPQNRKRCFLVSAIGYDRLVFPEPTELKLRLKDMLEDNPDPSYFLSDKAVQGLIRHKQRHDARGNGFGFKITDTDGIASTVKATGTWRNTDTLLEVGNRIRRLTPLECWRLMGFSDDDYHKVEAITPKTHLLRQAGNSIVVNVAEAIFKAMLIDRAWVKSPSLNAFTERTHTDNIKGE